RFIAPRILCYGQFKRVFKKRMRLKQTYCLGSKQ
ncbi:MAG: hypothetical protein ACI9JL_004626, partial [Paracoccaceae bacterium]